MHQRVVIRALSIVAVIAGCALVGCGGDDSPRRASSTWQPSDRLPLTAQHWWYRPVERYCEENQDCRTGETCQLMRLGTCADCPRGEDAHVCVAPDQDTFEANNRPADVVR